MNDSITCMIIDDEPIARDILSSFINKIPNLKLVYSCTNAMEAFELINKHTIDLFFLDINMPEISGLSLAKSINKNGKIIFTTAYREYAVDGFDLQAVDYLLKPISFDRFLQAINKYFEVTSISQKGNSYSLSNTNNDFIFVRADRKMVKVTFNDIIYIESFSDYIKIHLPNKTVITRETISNIETKLPQNSFIRIHRSYIIKIAKIECFTNEFIEINKKAIPISRSYKESVLKRLTKI